MLTTPAFEAWSLLINILIQKYLSNSVTICIIWNNQIEFQLQNQLNDSLVPIVSITREALAASLEQDIYDIQSLRAKLKNDTVQTNELEEKLIISIWKTFCEGFIAFQKDIPIFASAFHKASTLSIWRSIKSRFIFGYINELIEEGENDYFTEYLFKDQPNILVVEAENISSTSFNIKTNKFIGSKYEHPEEFYLLNRFDATTGYFEIPEEIATEKLRNLQGREIILGGFDYRPFVVVDYDIQPQVRDYSADNPNGTVFVDGAETRYLTAFCELYNCTFQFDSSDKGEWGFVYPNLTGDGLIGLVIERKTDMALGAFYLWYQDYEYLDLSVILGRSGITCLVPAPKILTSWNLPLKPFQFTLWLGVGGCLVLETLGLLVTRRMEQTLAQADNSWLNCIKFGYITTLKLFISQGSDYVVNSLSVRLVLFACYMIDIIITSIYGGGLASILTLPTFGETADSLERLYKFQLIWSATSYDWVLAIRDAKDDHVISEVLQNYRVYTFEQMREMAKTEDMGFVLERMEFGHFGNADFVTQEALDRLKLMIDDIYFQYTTAVVPRLWAFLSQFDTLIYNWHSSGLDKYWEWKVTADYSNANQQNQIESSMYTNFDTGPVKLGLSNFAGLILIWFVGVILSILIFALELLYFYKFKQRANKRDLHVE